jgi:D-alanyl-D-alanine dipeptidase
VGRSRLAAVAIAVSALAASCGAPPTPPVTGVTPTTTAPVAPSEAPTPTPVPTASVDSYAPPGFVALSDVDPTIRQDIRYATGHNFIGRPVNGYLEPQCLLTEPAARALASAQAAATARGLRLKVYDCYRPARAGEDFAAWAQTPGDDTMKTEFYPSLSKHQLFTDGFVGGGRTTHSSGSAVDLTLVPAHAPEQRPYVPGEALVPCTAPEGQRFPDNSVDMGTGFDCFDARSHTLSGGIGDPARENRLLLRQVMTDAGFVNYSNEWWHYDFVNDPHAGTYFDFPVAREALRPGPSGR